MGFGVVDKGIGKVVQSTLSLAVLQNKIFIFRILILPEVYIRNKFIQFLFL